MKMQTKNFAFALLSFPNNSLVCFFIANENETLTSEQEKKLKYQYALQEVLLHMKAMLDKTY